MSPVKYALMGVVLCFLASCSRPTPPKIIDLKLASDVTVCKSGPEGYFFSFASYTPKELTKYDHPRLVYSDEPTDFPRVGPNDNLSPAGKIKSGVLTVEMEVKMGDFYPETDDRPGLRLAAIGEYGELPTIPGPLLRVEEGTRLSVTIRNSLDSMITVYGLHKRPGDGTDSLIINPGDISKIEFDSGTPGTYYYWMNIGSNSPRRFDGEEEQLAGAFVVDPKGYDKKDRILMMNIFSEETDSTVSEIEFVEALTINGRSWPFTELMEYEVGEEINWKVINSTARNHPMHLHGFYYNVASRGNYLESTAYQEGKRDKIVTEMMLRGSIMDIQWESTRPGRWLFHCHLSFHVSNMVRLPGAEDMDNFEHEMHMAGLVTGIDIKPGPSDLIFRGEEREIEMIASSYKKGDKFERRFSLENEANADDTPNSPGPLLILTQYQPTYVTVKNNMDQATSVHWHGLEIDGWSDGVPNWSTSDGKKSPVIEPGEEFRYKLGLLRPGTFVYHSHLDDINQLTSGLYGPMIVLKEGETYDPSSDHVYSVGWSSPMPRSFEDLELNGSTEQKDKNVEHGKLQRLRLINIAPAGQAGIRVLYDGKPVLLDYIAKDGADIPPTLIKKVEQSPWYGVGEAADFSFTPTEKGVYEVQVSPRGGDEYWTEKWIVN